MAGIITGKEAKIFISTDASKIGEKGVTVWGISDFSLTFSRDVVEQELVGQPGNLRRPGAITIEGSLTNCKFAASGNWDALDSIVNAKKIIISGSLGTDSLSFYFVSAQVTSYEVSFGDASTITEASIDFRVLDPYNVTYTAGHISDA